jgi:hypothetical protein
VKISPAAWTRPFAPKLLHSTSMKCLLCCSGCTFCTVVSAKLPIWDLAFFFHTIFVIRVNWVYFRL